ncbi:MAG: PilZ domain-containing protein [Gammaproteobacteria bacterium]|nr:PilZ domain-containing protein [Gammaproteobacteria bacterium]
MRNENRRSTRHPTGMPVQLGETGKDKCYAVPCANVSTGGLACYAARAVPPGTALSIVFPALAGDTSLTGTVAWCRAVENVDEVFDIGVQFGADNDDTYRVRLCEQICRIEQYKRDVLLDEGRFLTSDEAAVEWISGHAAAFP